MFENGSEIFRVSGFRGLAGFQNCFYPRTLSAITLWTLLEPLKKYSFNNQRDANDVRLNIFSPVST